MSLNTSPSMDSPREQREVPYRIVLELELFLKKPNFPTKREPSPISLFLDASV